MSADLKDINEITVIQLEREKKEGFVIKSYDDRPVDAMNNVQRINFFIGANNSGKSRFLRSLFYKDSKNYFNSNDNSRFATEIENQLQKEILKYAEFYNYEKLFTNFFESRRQISEERLNGGQNQATVDVILIDRISSTINTLSNFN
ncbi:MAG TPA: hypothetical protein PLZ43_10095 [bacterium]|nr:hypothetical protein [bacterium]